MNPFVLPWPGPLVEATLLRRYHRFLADVNIPGHGVVVAHCVNSGRMEGLVRKGARVFLTRADAPGRKLQWTWQAIEMEAMLIGTNTALPNVLVGAMLDARVLPGFTSHRGHRAEVRYGANSRVDFSVKTSRGEHLIEVKNCHLVYPDRVAYFPDSVSTRASKHLHELETVVREGGRATVLFTVQRPDATSVRPSDLHDPEFALAARRAARAGVRFRALRMDVLPEGLRVTDEVPVDLEPYELERPRGYSARLAIDSGWERPKRTPS